MTANERSEMISRLLMAKNPRRQMEIECDLNGIKMEEVEHYMTEAGIPLPPHKRRMPDAAEIERRIRDGATLGDLASEYGVLPSHITRKLNRDGLDANELRRIAEENGLKRERDVRADAPDRKPGAGHAASAANKAALPSELLRHGREAASAASGSDALSEVLRHGREAASAASGSDALSEVLRCMREAAAALAALTHSAAGSEIEVTVDGELARVFVGLDGEGIEVTRYV